MNAIKQKNKSSSIASVMPSAIFFFFSLLIKIISYISSFYCRSRGFPAGDCSSSGVRMFLLNGLSVVLAIVSIVLANSAMNKTKNTLNEERISRIAITLMLASALLLVLNFVFFF